jgi:hypothetical protein
METVFVLGGLFCSDFAGVHVPSYRKGGVCEALDGMEGGHLGGDLGGFKGLLQGLGLGFTAFGYVLRGIGIR